MRRVIKFSDYLRLYTSSDLKMRRLDFTFGMKPDEDLT